MGAKQRIVILVLLAGAFLPAYGGEFSGAEALVTQFRTPSQHHFEALKELERDGGSDGRDHRRR